MKTTRALLEELGEQLYDELEQLFDGDIDELEVNFKIGFLGSVKVDVYKVKTEKIIVNLEE